VRLCKMRNVRVQHLYSYSQSYRLPEDWRGALMPMPIYKLGEDLWRHRAVFAALSPISQQCPPTGMQALFYYTIFNSTIGRHRDNGLLLVNLPFFPSPRLYPSLLH